MQVWNSHHELDRASISNFKALGLKMNKGNYSKLSIIFDDTFFERKLFSQIRPLIRPFRPQIRLLKSASSDLISNLKPKISSLKVQISPQASNKPSQASNHPSREFKFTNGQMNLRKPSVLQNFVPFRAAALLTPTQICTYCPWLAGYSLSVALVCS